MGCTTSTTVEKSPPEPVPNFSDLCATQIEQLPGEPELSRGKDNFTSNEVLNLIVRKIGDSNKGGTFQIETLKDSLFHGLQVHPAKPGIGVKKRLEDLVYLHVENDQRPIAFAIKNVPKGLNYYWILSPVPLRETQKPVIFEGPRNCKDMYPYANIVFNIETTVVSIKVSGQGKDDAPLYTMRQCNEKVWVIKKKQMVCAAVEQVRGMAKLTCFRVCVCAGMDPGFVGLLVTVIDSFLETAKSQLWKLYPRDSPVQSINWPKLDDETQEKLFGREFKWM